MKIKVFEPTPPTPPTPPTTPPEKVLRLRLRESIGAVFLEAVSEDGTRMLRGDILLITAAGIDRCAGLTEQAGLPLEAGKVKLNY